MRAVLLCGLVALGGAALGCDNRFQARVGAAVLPQAQRTTDVPSGLPVIAIVPGAMPSLPTGPFGLAIDVDVPWSQVRAAVETAPRPLLVVGDHNRRRGFVLEDELANERTLQIRATGRGKFCLAPPGADSTYCTESGDHRHISAAFVREVVAKAVREYDIHQAWIIADPDILWADLVRTIDGARTCCKQPVRVALAR